MAKTAVANPVNLKVLNRQISSEASHIDRIRAANSKRQFITLWSSHEIKNPVLDLKLNQEDIIKRRISMSDFYRRRQSHEYCVPSNSLDEFYEKRFKHNYLGGAYRNEVSRRKFSTSLKPDANQKLSTESKQNTKTEVNKPLKISTVKTGKENSEKTERKLSRKHLVKTKISPTVNTSVLKRRPPPVIKNEHGKQTLNKEGNLTSENSLSPRDVVILKWLHGINCPFSEKEQNASDSTEIKRSAVRILNKPLNTSINKISVIIPDNTKPSDVKEKLKSSNKVREMNPRSNEKKNAIHSDPQTEKGETDSSETVTKDVPSVEMYVSELGKLQIILNPKSFSPEDAAILIWIDDIPKTFFFPDYRRRLSLAPKPYFQSAVSSSGVIKSQSLPQIEDTATPKPDIYFPPATILKSFAIDSKIRLKEISEDFANSVYYKRCNLDHAGGIF